jgi:autotransporter translocation and assembly factor TamB
MRIEGLANGSISVSDPIQNLDIDADITTSELRLDNDSLGLVTFKGGYRQETEEATFSVASENTGKSFVASGKVGVSSTNNKLQATVDLNGASVALLDRFVNGYVTDLKGLATGKLDISGTTNRPSVKGSLKIDSVGVKVLYLGTHYSIPKLNVNIDDNLIEFGNFTIIDKNNTKASASGYISHDHFDNLNFDFEVTARNFVFLNTEAADSDLFYGDVIADGKVYFTGPLNDLQLRITARPIRGTHFYLPLSDSKDIGRSDYITFKSYGTEMKEEKKKRKDNVKLNVKLDISATPDAQIDVIMDAASGDMISANGTGNLQIQVNTEGDFSMFGNYEISNGSYNFTLQRLTSWKFDIDKNSSIT